MKTSRFLKGLAATALMMGIGGVAHVNAQDVNIITSVESGDGITPSSTLTLLIEFDGNTTAFEPDGAALVLGFDTTNVAFDSVGAGDDPDGAGPDSPFSVGASLADEVVAGTLVERRVTAAGVQIGLNPQIMRVNFTVQASAAAGYDITVGLDATSSNPVSSLQVSPPSFEALSANVSGVTGVSEADWMLLD